MRKNFRAIFLPFESVFCEQVFSLFCVLSYSALLLRHAAVRLFVGAVLLPIMRYVGTLLSLGIVCRVCAMEFSGLVPPPRQIGLVCSAVI